MQIVNLQWSLDNLQFRLVLNPRVGAFLEGRSLALPSLALPTYTSPSR